MEEKKMKRKNVFGSCRTYGSGSGRCGADQKGSSADGNEEMEIVLCTLPGAKGDAQYKIHTERDLQHSKKDNPGITIKRGVLSFGCISAAGRKLGVRQGNCRTFAW